MKRTIYILALFAAVTAQAQVTRVVTNNLVGWWTVENNNWVDRINGTTGTNFGGVTFAAGNLGNCGSFDGTSAGVDIPDNATIRLANIFSISLWVRVGNSPPAGTNYLLEKVNYSASSTEAYAIYLNGTTGLVTGIARDGSDNKAFAVSTQSILDGCWHFVVLTFTGLTSKLYIDGTQVATTTAGTFGTTDSASRLQFGRFLRDDFPSGGTWFKGQLDDIRLWKSTSGAAVLSPQLIRSMYLSTRPSP